MKKILLIVTTLLFTAITYTNAQKTQLLKAYNFNQGGHTLLGTFSESDQNDLQDSLGEFYTDDISILNQFKEEWTFKKPSPMYACGYHYQVTICKNGVALERFAINLNCNEIVSDSGYFFFDPKKLSMFLGKVKEPVRKRDRFASVAEARTELIKMLTDTALILADSPAWLHYEGSFRFIYTCQKGGSDCGYAHAEEVMKNVRSIIQQSFPDESFELREFGGSSTEVYLEVACNKSLSDKFDLFNRDTKGYYGVWRPYLLGLVSYWR